MLLLTDKKQIFSEIKNHAIQYASLGIFLVFFLFMGILITGKEAPIYSSNSYDLTTFDAFIKMGEYLSPYSWMWPLMIGLILISLLKKAFLFHNLISNAANYKNELINFIFDPRTILLTSLCVMIIANLIHNRGFLAGRAIIPMVPLIFISFFICLKEINDYFLKKGVWLNLYAVGILIISVYGFYLSIESTRLNKTYSYEEDFDDREKIESAAKKLDCVKISEVGYTIIEFYNLKNNTNVKYCN